MTDQVRRFEVVILRPLQLLLLGSAVATGFTRHWFWLGGSLLALLYLGTVGSKLLPLQTVSDLAKGPLQNPTAGRVVSLFSPGVRSGLVGPPLTRVGSVVVLA